MSTLEAELPVQTSPEASNSNEEKPKRLLTNPREIDLHQPDRAKGFSIADITHVPGSKLIAELKTPLDDIGIISIPIEGSEPIISILSKERFDELSPGSVVELSDEKGTGKAYLVLDEASRRLIIFASHPDDAYELKTTLLDRYYPPVTNRGQKMSHYLVQGSSRA